MKDSCQINNARNDPRLRKVLGIALAANATLFLVQAIAGWLAHSNALLADAMDFLGDAINYGISLFVFSMPLVWRSSVAMGKGIVMACYGLLVIALVGFGIFGEHLPSAPLMAIFSIVGLITNISVASLLYAFRKGDSNMMSVWLDTRNDVLVNIGVLLAAGGVFLTQHRWPDLVVALAIALLGITSGYQVIRQARHELRFHRD